MMDNMKNLYLRASKAGMSMTQSASSSTAASASAQKVSPTKVGSSNHSSRSSSRRNTSTTTDGRISHSSRSGSTRSSSGSSSRRSGKNTSSNGSSHHHHSRRSSSSRRNGDNNNKRKGRRPTGNGGGGGGVLRMREEEQQKQQQREQHERMNQNLQSHRNDDSSDDDDDDHDEEDSYEEEIVESSDDDYGSNDDSDDGQNSVYTTITVETTRTKENENRKPTIPAIFGGGGGGKTRNTQVSVGGMDPVGDLQHAMNDITKLSIYMKKVSASQDVASAFLSLMRGDNRSWEAIAVDILRQKARWESIVIEECSDARSDENSNGSSTPPPSAVATDYLDLILTHILCVDNCAYLHLSNFVWTDRTAWSMMALQFCKSINKLQLDLIDLTSSIPMLSRGLKYNKSLKVLITSRCGLKDDELGILLSHLPEPLEELRIFGNRCRSKGLASLTAAIQERTTCLKHLDLSYQHVGPDEDFDISWFAEALGRKNKTVRVLDLDNVSLDDGHLAHLVAALCKNRTLEELMLNHNKISGEGVALLAAKFGEMKGLKKISMYSNMFDAPGNDGSNNAGAAAAGAAGSTGIDRSKNETVADNQHNNTVSDDGRSNTQSNGSPTDGGLTNNGISNLSPAAAVNANNTKGQRHHHNSVDTGTPQRSNRNAGGKENAFGH